MTMRDIRKRATALGVDPGKMKKVDLIHAIQKTEGYRPCFGQWPKDGNCPYLDCCWREDCVPA